MRISNYAMTISRVPAGTNLVEWYFDQGWTDGLPVVPPTGETVAACIAVLGGDPELLECRVPPRYGGLTREVLAINMGHGRLQARIRACRARRDAGANHQRLQS
jgi:hypothetical protein